MPLNIHPMFVHFPIAFLTVYGGLELLRFKKILSQPWWFYVKMSFVVFGFLGALLALQTGGLIEDEFERSSLGPLMETHASFATATTVVFGILAGLYLLTWFKLVSDSQAWLKKNGIRQLWQLLITTHQVFYKPWFLISSAFAGLVLITITGALGGALVHGPEVDPVVSAIYHLFF